MHSKQMRAFEAAQRVQSLLDATSRERLNSEEATISKLDIDLRIHVNSSTRVVHRLELVADRRNGSAQFSATPRSIVDRPTRSNFRIIVVIVGLVGLGSLVGCGLSRIVLGRGMTGVSAVVGRLALANKSARLDVLSQIVRLKVGVDRL
jgi:hypothetical protein